LRHAAKHYLAWFSCSFHELFLEFSCLTVEVTVKNRTDTLEVGSQAPEFSLSAANREGSVTLAGLRERGPVIVEFLRGTW